MVKTLLMELCERASRVRQENSFLAPEDARRQVFASRRQPFVQSLAPMKGLRHQERTNLRESPHLRPPRRPTRSQEAMLLEPIQPIDLRLGARARLFEQSELAPRPVRPGILEDFQIITWISPTGVVGDAIDDTIANLGCDLRIGGRKKILEVPIAEFLQIRAESRTDAKSPFGRHGAECKRGRQIGNPQTVFGAPRRIDNPLRFYKDSRMDRRSRFQIRLVFAAVFILITVEARPSQAQTTFPDERLERVVREALGKPEATLTDADLASLEVLDALDGGVRDLTGIEKCVNLRDLDLHQNLVSDLSPLSSLRKLEDLHLGDNRFTDLQPLAGLVELASLSIHMNRLSDLTALSDLRKLHSLDLAVNNVRDTAPLAGLAGLERLDLRLNQLTDIAPLAGLTNLHYLDVGENALTGLAGVEDMKNLEMLFAHSNKISSIEPLAGLVNLTTLNLSGNPLGSLAPLGNLKNLSRVSITEAGLSGCEPLVSLPDLVELNLYGNKIVDLTPLVEREGPIAESLILMGNPLSPEAETVQLDALRAKDINVRWWQYKGGPIEVKKGTAPSGLPWWGALVGAGLFLVITAFIIRSGPGSAKR